MLQQTTTIVPWELYMLADDTKTFPMTCHLRFWFSGRFERAQFSSALLQALQRHPLLTAYREAGFFRDAWRMSQPNIDEQLEWLDGKKMDWSNFVDPDYRTRFVVEENGDETILYVKFHHAICDGIGTIQVVEDALQIYDQLQDGKQHTLVPIKTELVEGRGRFHMTLRAWLETGWWQFLRIAKFFKAWPATLELRDPKVAAVRAKLDASASPGAVVRLVLPKAETQAVMQRCKAQGITLNDFMLAALFEALAAAQTKETLCAFRVAVPTNLRMPIDDHAPAANLVSMVFLDRFKKDTLDRTALINGIAKEMQHIKDKRLGMAMISVCNVMTYFFGVMRAFLQLPLTQTTTVLTNLGRPLAKSPLMGADGLVRSGNMTMTGFDTLPPVRNRTRLSVSVNGYGGALSVSGRYDSTTNTAQETESFLRLYLQRLQS